MISCPNRPPKFFQGSNFRSSSSGDPADWDRLGDGARPHHMPVSKRVSRCVDPIPARPRGASHRQLSHRARRQMFTHARAWIPRVSERPSLTTSIPTLGRFSGHPLPRGPSRPEKAHQGHAQSLLRRRRGGRCCSFGGLFGRLVGGLDLDLEEGFHVASADGALVGLEAQHPCALVAHAHVPTREDGGVSGLRHADDALTTAVVIQVIRLCRVGGAPGGLVDAVDLLQLE